MQIREFSMATMTTTNARKNFFEVVNGATVNFEEMFGELI